ncbi:hypothetical protein ACFUP3_12000 [Bacillus paralicheniformis]
MEDKLKITVHHIEVNRETMSDKAALDLFIKAIKKIIAEADV